MDFDTGLVIVVLTAMYIMMGYGLRDMLSKHEHPSYKKLAEIPVIPIIGWPIVLFILSF